MNTPCGPLRADAARNRSALLDAARVLFAERGLDAPLDEIARRAGVGNATLYRRFPTRSALVEAVFVERLREYVAAVDAALAEPDAGAAFRGCLLRLFRLQAQDRGLADLLVTSTPDAGEEVERLRALGVARTGELIARAQRAGALRPDFAPQDVPLLLMANAGLVHRTATAAPGACERVASLLLDGLACSAATPGPAALPVAEVEAAVARSACPTADPSAGPPACPPPACPPAGC